MINALSYDAFSIERVHQGAFFGYEGARERIISIILSKAIKRTSYAGVLFYRSSRIFVG